MIEFWLNMFGKDVDYVEVQSVEADFFFIGYESFHIVDAQIVSSIETDLRSREMSL